MTSSRPAAQELADPLLPAAAVRLQIPAGLAAAQQLKSELPVSALDESAQLTHVQTSETYIYVYI